MYEDDSFLNFSSSSLDSLTNKEISILDKLSHISQQISYENRREEDLERELKEVNMKINNIQTPFDLILEKQVVDAEKELINVKYKLKQQYRLSNALDQLLSALYSSPIKKPKLKQKQIKKNANLSSFYEENIKQQINEINQDKIKLTETLKKEQMKRNLLDSEQLRLSDCISIIQQKKQKRLQILKNNKLKYNFDYQYFDKITNTNQIIEKRKKKIFKKYKFICRNSNISNVVSFLPQRNYLDVKLSEYKMRVEMTNKLMKQLNNIKEKSKNELEKQSFNLISWLEYLNQMILECLDSYIGNINYITVY